MLSSAIQIDWESPTPVYRQIAEQIRDAAVRAPAGPAKKLPPTRELARRLGVNRNTVVAAYDMLASEGWTESQTGRGTFLLSRRSAVDGERGGRWFTAFSRTVAGAANGDLESIYRLATASEGISFVGSYPSGELMPVEAFRRAMTRALVDSGPASLSYGPSTGDPALRETVAAAMRDKGSEVRAEELLITNGAQQALDLVFRTFLDPGDTIITEEPTYTGALSAAAALGARVIGVPVDGEGMRTDLLEGALEHHRPRLLYVQPTFQNPTAAVMSEARRAELLALTRRHRCPVVEDDWAGDLRFEGADLPSLHALDGERHVIHVGTYSKKLMPGIRVGWAAAPTEVLEKMTGLKRIQDCGTSPLLQAALHNFLQEGGLERHLDRVRPAYRARRDRMIAALERHFPGEARWNRPTGGLFVWVTLPEHFDGNELFIAARRAGVLYSKGDWFHSDGSGRNTFRLTYSAASPEQIDEGVEALGKLIRERRSDPADPRMQATGEALPIF